MKKQEFTTKQERKLRFAEAGVLFTLILGLTIFVGARLADRSGEADVQPTAVAVIETPRGLEPIPPTADCDPTIEAEPAVADEPEVAAEPVVTIETAPVVQPPVTYAAAEEAYQTGCYEDAADMFSRYTLEHPDNAWGHYMLGLSEWKAGDPEVAEEAFLAALALKPDHVKSLVNYGRVLIEMDRADDAELQLAGALEVDPANLDARRVMGRAQYCLGRLDEAADSYLIVLAQRESDAWSLNNLGLIRIEQERFAEALPALAKAAQLKGDEAVIQNNLGVALERTGHPAAAARAYAAAAESGSGHAKAELSLARVEGLAGDETDADFDLAAVAAMFSARPAYAMDAEEPAAVIDESVAVTADSVQVDIPAEFVAVAPAVEVASSLTEPQAQDGDEQ
jgi:predicted Zn-dependent protease